MLAVPCKGGFITKVIQYVLYPLSSEGTCINAGFKLVLCEIYGNQKPQMSFAVTTPDR